MVQKSIRELKQSFWSLAKGMNFLIIDLLLNYLIIIKKSISIMADDGARYGIEGPLRNLRSEAHIELKKANVVYTECVTTKFMPGWLKGESLQINEVCASEYEDMMAKHSGIYGESPMPFKPMRFDQ